MKPNYEEAFQLLKKGAYKYKLSHNFVEAGNLFLKAKDVNDVSSYDICICLKEASECFKNVDYVTAIKCLKMQCWYYKDNGNYLKLADIYFEIGELYKVNNYIDKAI